MDAKCGQLKSTSENFSAPGDAQERTMQSEQQ